MARITLDINGEKHEVEVSGTSTLLFAIREKVGLTGTKYGCGEGQCGACTVLVNGQPTRSCMTPARSVVGKKLRTIEGLAEVGRLHPVQSAFLKHEALQCGYCTSGMILSAVGLLEANPHPERAQILEFMNGNVCRCGTYSRIVAAIEEVAGRPAQTSEARKP